MIATLIFSLGAGSSAPPSTCRGMIVTAATVAEARKKSRRVAWFSD
jgi:hypothetical protein